MANIVDVYLVDINIVDMIYWGRYDKYSRYMVDMVNKVDMIYWGRYGKRYIWQI